MHPNRLPMYVCMCVYVCMYVSCMYVCTYACMSVCIRYVYMCVWRHSNVIHWQYAYHICPSMYVQTATIKNTNMRNTLLHSWRKHPFWCVMQVVDGGVGHMQRLFCICTCFHNVRPVQGETFHGQCSIGHGTNMYTLRSLLGTGKLHYLTTCMGYRLTMDHQFARGGRQGQAVSNSDFTHMLL